MHMYDIARPAAFMQVVHILRDNRDLPAMFSLQSCQGNMRRIGRDRFQRGAALIVKAVDQCRVCGKAFGRGDLLDRMVFPQAARIAKRLNPTFGRYTRAGEDDDVLGLCHNPLMPSVLFVCLGNICRSPTAEAVFRAKAAGRDILIDSAGMGGWHAGDPPDSRARAEGERRGYSFAGQAARAVRAEDFEDFDFILAMDSANLRDLTAQQPSDGRAQLALFLPNGGDVPDPYYGGSDGFVRVVDLIEAAADHWLDVLQSYVDTAPPKA